MGELTCDSPVGVRPIFGKPSALAAEGLRDEQRKFMMADCILLDSLGETALHS